MVSDRLEQRSVSSSIRSSPYDSLTVKKNDEGLGERLEDYSRMKKASEGRGGVMSGSNQKNANQNSEEIVSSIIYREDVGQTHSLEFLGGAD